MITLTRIFQDLRIFHYIQPPVSSHIKVRFKYAILDTVERKLGLLDKPKRPMVPYFRYMAEVRQSVVAQHPKLTTREHVKLISVMWNSLDNTKREKYYDLFANDSIVYKEAMAKYNKTTTEDERRKVEEKRKELKEEIEKRKYVRSQRKKAGALHRPKRPIPAFFTYLKTEGDRQASEKWRDYLQRKSSEWKSLSESQKEAFKPETTDRQRYRDDILEWKGKMIKSGNYDVLRSEIPTFKKFDDVLIPKRKPSVDVND